MNKNLLNKNLKKTIQISFNCQPKKLAKSVKFIKTNIFIGEEKPYHVCYSAYYKNNRFAYLYFNYCEYGGNIKLKYTDFEPIASKIINSI